MEEGVGDGVARAALGRYGRLPGRGKPAGARDEWTVVAALVGRRRRGGGGGEGEEGEGEEGEGEEKGKEKREGGGEEEEEAGKEIRQRGGEMRVLALGTGTKCVPRAARGETTVNDAHAEAVARRAFAKWALQATEFEPGVPLWNADGSWNEEVELWLYTSKEPCGSSRLYISEEHENKRVKCDLLEPMRKPGKGSATDSISCADKLAKWLKQGLISKKWHPHTPRLAGVVIGGPFENRETLEAMLAARNCPPCRIEHTQVPFEHDSIHLDPKKAHPSGYSLNWMLSDKNGPPEVTQPNGKKMGATSKGDHVNPKHISRLAPINCPHE